MGVVWGGGVVGIRGTFQNGMINDLYGLSQLKMEKLRKSLFARIVKGKKGVATPFFDRNNQTV